jgi:hypothetical protein
MTQPNPGLPGPRHVRSVLTDDVRIFIPAADRSTAVGLLRRAR